MESTVYMPIEAVPVKILDGKGPQINNKKAPGSNVKTGRLKGKCGPLSVVEAKLFLNHT